MVILNVHFDGTIRFCGFTKHFKSSAPKGVNNPLNGQVPRTSER